MLQFPAEVFELAKKGATSFHCSEELWNDPLEIQTGMNEKQLNDLRKGWDLLIDIDSSYIDYSKASAITIIEMLRFHGIKNYSIKFSGSKGFHILVPSKEYPEEINGVQTKDMFPEWPRIISKYIIEKTKKEVAKKIGDAFGDKDKYKTAYKYIKGEKREQEIMDEVSPDVILVSPRHLFRMPYSLHEKTALASIVLTLEELKKFELRDADPLKINKDDVRDFMPPSEENEAKELLVQALDWDKEYGEDEYEIIEKKGDYKPIKLDNLSEKFFPPSIQKMLKGLEDGRKRALFVLINFFRAIGMEKEELEQRISDWNKKNPVPLKKGYIKSQLSWSYRNKIIPPPNYDKDYYKGIGCPPEEREAKFKNPVNYTVKRTLAANKQDEENKKREEKNKKRKEKDKKKVEKSKKTKGNKIKIKKDKEDSKKSDEFNNLQNKDSKNNKFKNN